MAKIGSIVIDLKMDIAKLKKGVDEANKRIKTASSQMSRAFKAVKAAAAGLATAIVALAATASVGVFTSLIKGSIELADSIAKVSDKIGFNTNQFQELRFAAEQAGVANRTLDMALQRFSRRVGEVAQGQGELLKTAKAYNVELRDGQGQMRSNIDILNDFADVIQKAESDQERLRIAFKLFDSEGAALVNLMKNGSAGVNALREEANRLGIVIEEKLIRNAEKAADQLNIVHNVMKNRLSATILEMMPQIKTLAEVTTAFLTKLFDLVNATVMGFKFLDFWIANAGDTALITLQKISRASGEGVIKGQDFLSGLNIPFVSDAFKDASKVNQQGVSKLNESISQVQNRMNQRKLDLFKNLTGFGLPQGSKSGLRDFETILPKVTEKTKDLQKASERLSNSIHKVVQEGFRDNLHKTIQDFKDFTVSLENSVKTSKEFNINMSSYNNIINQSKDSTDQYKETLEEIARLSSVFPKLQDELFIAQQKLMDQFAEANREQVNDLQVLIDVTQEWGRTFEDSLISSFRDGKFAFKDMAASILEDIARMTLRMSVIAPLFGGQGFGGKAISKPLIPRLLGGVGKILGFADGGNPPVMKPSIVGERGPELFTPGVSGTITPNHALGGGVTLNQYFTINTTDSRSFKDRLAEHAKFIGNVSVDAVQRTQNRRGNHGPLDSGRRVGA